MGHCHVSSCLHSFCLHSLHDHEAANYSRMLIVIVHLQVPRRTLPTLPTALGAAQQPLLQRQLATLLFASACSTPPLQAMQQLEPRQQPLQLPLLRLMRVLPPARSPAPSATLSPPQPLLRPLPRPLPQARDATASSTRPSQVSAPAVTCLHAVHGWHCVGSSVIAWTVCLHVLLAFVAKGMGKECITLICPECKRACAGCSAAGFACMI